MCLDVLYIESLWINHKQGIRRVDSFLEILLNVLAHSALSFSHIRPCALVGSKCSLSWYIWGYFQHLASRLLCGTNFGELQGNSPPSFLQKKKRKITGVSENSRPL